MNMEFLKNRTEEEYKKGHVDVEKIYNIPYMFDKPGGIITFYFLLLL